MSQDFWKTRLDVKEADFPEYLSFSTYQQLDKCPKKWLLSNSEYPQIWPNQGYPRKVYGKTIMGTATHQALEIIIKKMREENIDHGSKNYVNLIKQEGGLRKILKREIGSLLNQVQYKENPRYLRIEKELNLRIKKKYLEEYFIQLRSFLGKLNLPHKSDKTKIKQPMKTQASVMTEYFVKSKVINWKGFIDLVINDTGGATLIDFKTGRETESHKEQLELYQLIWMDDERVKEIPVKQLLVKYPNSEKYYEPLTKLEIEERKDRYQAIAVKLKKDLSSDNLAKPSKENCEYCDVKQLCNDYWEHLENLSEQTYGDFELEIQTNSDQQDIYAKIISSNIAENGSIVKILFQDIEDSYREFFIPEKNLRILNGHYDNDEEEMSKNFFIQIQKTTEVFLIND